MDNNTYDRMSEIFDELRDMAETHNIVVMTATQPNRFPMEGYQSLPRHMRSSKGPDIVCVDYLSLLHLPDKINKGEI